MPISFGSVGDIISVCLLVKDLVTALDESRGSAAEYKEVRLELRALEQALLEVEVLSRSHSSTVKLNALYATARKAALDCRQPVEAFLHRINKYDPSLGKSSTRNIARNTAMKIRWQLSQKDEVTRFRAEINAHSSSINMLLATVNVNLAQTNHKEISDRLNDSSNKQNALLEEVRDRLEENSALISAGNAITMKVKEALNFNWFAQFGAELKEFMLRIININVATYNAVISVQGVISGGLERSLAHEPFILEDAIGRITPVHVQFINSWDAFEAVLNLRFRNIQGHTKVKRKEYILQENYTRREISRSRPWEGAFLPGQRINMSLIFDSQKHRSVGTSCPSCSTISEDSHDFEIQCKSCGIWYLRVTEVFDVEPPAYPPALSSRTNHSPAEFGKPSFNNISYGPKPPSQFQALPSSPKRKLDSTELEEDDLSQFKRVRLVRKERRVKGVSNPFLQHPISSKSALDSADKQQKDEELALDELRALQVSLGDVHPQTLIRLHSYARLLRNWGKYQTAEMIIRDALQSGEAELLAHRPEILQLMLSGLMTVLVDQQKLVEAEELWHTWVETFRIKLGEDSAKVLEEQFRQAHPLRPLSTVTLEGAVFFDTTTSVNQPVALGNTTFVTAPSSDDELEHSNEIVISNQDATKSGLLGLFGPFGANSAYKNVGAALQPSTDIVEAQKESEDSQELGTPSSPSPINFIRLQKEYSGSKTSALQYDQPSFQRITTGKYSLNDFEILRTVGTGTFARVHLIKSIHNKRFYALKVLKKQNIVKLKQVEHACEERRILSKIKHPFLITLWGTFSDSKNLYMVTDYAEGGELFSLLRKSHRFPDPVAKFYAAEVILAIAYLHSRHIVYRDIKPENILLDRYGHIKLCDFGFAKETEDCIWTLCGTPDYLAPEIVASKGHSHSVDWWALGVLIFEMLCGFTPFWDGDSHIRTYTNILRCKVKYPPHIHPNARDLLQSLITPDLTRRLGNLTGGVRDIQEHAWFQEVTWERLQNRDIEAPYILPIKPGGGDTSQYDKYPEEAELYSDMEPDEYSHLFEDF